MHDVHGQILEKKNVPRRSGFDKSSAVRWQQLCKTWNHQTAKGKSWANEEFPKRGTYTIKMVVIFGNLNHTAFSKNNGYPIKKIKTVTLLEVGPIRVTSPNSHAGCTNRTPFKFRSPEYIFRKKKKTNRPKTRRWKERFSKSRSSCIMVSSHLSPLTRSIASWPHWFVPVSALRGYQYRHLLHHWPRYLNVKAEWFTYTDTVYVHVSTVSCNWHKPKNQFNSKYT